MANRQTEAKSAALIASRLSGKLLDLSDLEKWYEERIGEAVDLRNELIDAVDALFSVVKGKPIPASVPTPPSPVVYVPVDGHDGYTRMGGSWYIIEGFVGGTQDNGRQRPNGKRHFQKEAIVDVSKSGLVGVDRTWLMGQYNSDVVNFVKKFPKSVTLF